MKYDVVIVGAGPAGIFTAIEMVRNGSDKKILIIEKGASVEKRSCPKAKTKHCMNCKPYCHITTGFSGAGASIAGAGIVIEKGFQKGGDLVRSKGIRVESLAIVDSMSVDGGCIFRH